MQRCGAILALLVVFVASHSTSELPISCGGIQHVEFCRNASYSVANVSIGVVLEQTVDGTAFDIEQAERRMVVRLALEDLATGREDIGDAKLLDGFCVRALFVDPQVTTESSARWVSVLREQYDAVAIIGPRRSSQAAVAAWSAAAPPSIPLISPTATSPLLEDVGKLGGRTYPWLFRSSPNDALQALGMAQLVELLGAVRIAVGEM